MRALRLSAALLVLASCGDRAPLATPAPRPTVTEAATPSPTGESSTAEPTVGATPTVPAPPPPLEPPADHLRFSVIGDWGAGNRAQDAVAAAMRARHAQAGLHAFVTTGDNIYPDGHPREFDRAWHRPYGWVRDARLNMVASLGNHDIQTEGGRAVMDLLSIPSRFYERTLGPVRFIVLDGNRPNDRAQMEFLRAAVASRSAPWTVVVMHQPIHTCGRYAGSLAVRAAWEHELAGKVDLVLAGHDHNYQRFYPMYGVTYVVTGGGGAGLYEMGTCPDGTPQLETSSVSYHFLAVEATMTSLRWEAVATDGTAIDTWELSLVAS